MRVLFWKSLLLYLFPWRASQACEHDKTPRWTGFDELLKRGNDLRWGVLAGVQRGPGEVWGRNADHGSLLCMCSLGCCPETMITILVLEAAGRSCFPLQFFFVLMERWGIKLCELCSGKTPGRKCQEDAQWIWRVSVPSNGVNGAEAARWVERLKPLNVPASKVYPNQCWILSIFRVCHFLRFQRISADPQNMQNHEWFPSLGRILKWPIQ